MALVTCPECGRANVSDTALACPGCGYPVKEHFEKTNIKKETSANSEQGSISYNKHEEDTRLIQEDPKESIRPEGSEEKEEKKKRIIMIAGITLAVILLFVVLTVGHREQKTEISKIDITTSLIKSNSIIPAADAYKLVQERLMSCLGDDYTYEVNDDGKFIGVYKKGDSNYSYIIACTVDKDNGEIIPSGSKKHPKCIYIYDCTSKEPTVESLSMLISVFLDNTKQSEIETILEEKKKISLNDTFPDELAIAINGGVYYVNSDIELEDAYNIELAAEYYRYGEINPLAALDYIFSNDVTARDKIVKLTPEQGHSLVEYYMQHEQDYFNSYDAFLERSRSDNGAGWLPVDKNEKAWKVLEISDVYVGTDNKATTCYAKITNNGTKSYGFIRIYGMFKNDRGETLDMKAEYANGTDVLAPGDEIVFSLSVGPNEKITNCDLYLDSAQEKTE